jgi:hypothetical protein
MSAPLFASLTAGMLARKGEAHPSKEPSFGHRPWQPPVTPAPTTPPAPPRVVLPEDEGDLTVARMKVKLNEVAQTWPAPKPNEPTDADGSGWVPNRQQTPLQLASLGVPFKTTIRLTHAQARAVKLAALVLDKPQQEILTAGLLERLEALACADLAKCSCFRAVIEGLKTPESPQQAEIPI